MKVVTGAWLFIILLTCLVFTQSLWAAVEIPDPKLCDAESTEVRQGRPGGAEVKTVDGVGPMEEMTRAQKLGHQLQKRAGKFPGQINAISVWP